jgi:anti-sigma-K factor RskA
MTTIQHQTDLVEAYALGVLEPHEQASFEEHIAECTDCRKLAHATEEAAQMLVLAVRPSTPPLRCKRTVLSRIEREQFLRTPTPRRAARRVSLSTWTAVAAVFAMMLTGGWAWSLQGRLNQTTNELARANTELANMRGMVVQQATQAAQMQQQLGQFITYSNVLANGDEVCLMKNERAKAKCYARPGENQAVMFVSGLEPLPAGQAYQLWLANDQTQAPLNVFNTKTDGSADVIFTTSEAFDRYDAIMITVEDAQGADTPSDITVLSGQF